MSNYYSTTSKKLIENTKIPLLVMDTPNDIFLEFALQMVSEIIENNKNNKKTVLIIPCGPIGQYDVFIKLVNRFKIDLKNTYFIHMDEYLVDDNELICENDPFSFRKCMNECLYSKIDKDLIMPQEQRIFPNPNNINEIPQLIEKLGGVDIAFGGVALNGHIAFNEPQPEMTACEFAELPTRIITLNTETRVKDAILTRGGAVDTVPEKAITVGMKEILGARKVRLSMTLDMQRAIIRKACLGEVTAAYPLSLVQHHSDVQLIVTQNVVARPFGD